MYWVFQSRAITQWMATQTVWIILICNVVISVIGANKIQWEGVRESWASANLEAKVSSFLQIGAICEHSQKRWRNELEEWQPLKHSGDTMGKIEWILTGEWYHLVLSFRAVSLMSRDLVHFFNLSIQSFQFKAPAPVRNLLPIWLCKQGDQRKFDCSGRYRYLRWDPCL